MTLISSKLLMAILLAAWTVCDAQTAGQIEPNAGKWRTWILSSGSELRLPNVPDAASSRQEIAWLKSFMAQQDRMALEQAEYWNAGSPTYRWIEMFSDRLRQGTLGVSMPSFRGYALLSVAMYDATVAAWDSKYTHSRPRPSEADPSVKPLVAVPRSPLTRRSTRWSRERRRLSWAICFLRRRSTFRDSPKKPPVRA